jgi:hypothetical protein
MVMKRKYLTTYQGVPVSDNQNSLTVGSGAPFCLKMRILSRYRTLSKVDQDHLVDTLLILCQMQSKRFNSAWLKIYPGPTSSLAGVY